MSRRPGIGIAGRARSSTAPTPRLFPQKITTADVALVQVLIERCLQLYMGQQEVQQALHQQAQIAPEFTQLVWSKLEQENATFFKAYYTRLKLKDQIILFNYLLGAGRLRVVAGEHGRSCSRTCPI